MTSIDLSKSGRQAVIAALSASGWVADSNTPAIMRSAYGTSFGTKTARAYLRGHLLTFHFYSECRNILKDCEIAMTGDQDAIFKLVREQADRVHDRIIKSYSINGFDLGR